MVALTVTADFGKAKELYRMWHLKHCMKFRSGMPTKHYGNISEIVSSSKKYK